MRSIREYLTSCVEEEAFPGAVWMVTKDGDALDRGAVGALGQGLGPVQEDTLYDLASLTKIMVTYALMRQLEEGLVRLEDTLDVFLPRLKGHEKGGITLFEVLTHTSVLSGPGPLRPQAESKEVLLEALLRQAPRTDSPTAQYTCEGYILLGEALQVIDGEGLDQVLRRRVLEPLGMSHTGYNPGPELQDRIAPTEFCPWRGRVVRGQVHDEKAVLMGGVSGNAGLFGTAADVMQAMAVALTGRTSSEDRFLHRATLDAMTGNYTAGSTEHRGLGFMLAGPGAPAGDLMSSKSFGHTGFTGTCMWADPVSRLCAVLLTNRIHPTRENEGIYRARHIFHNLVVLHYGE